VARRRFAQVDVFTTEAYRGNPVAVVLDAEGLDGDAMQRIARWTNLSETTFVLPPDELTADYRVRIFTPDTELPFAGHPTLGTCHAWSASGGVPHEADVVVQSCGVGLVPVRRDGARLAFAAPPLVRSGPLDDAELDVVVTALGIDHADVVDASWVDNGPGWAAVLLEDADAVLAVTPDFGGRDLDIGVAGPHAPGSACQLEVRAFFPAGGRATEDPVTGSLNASLAQWLLGAGRITAPYVASQGTALGRLGRVHVDQDPDGQVWVGGGTTTCIDGVVSL
jgi:PhzF family phenazine biosynthesis protein